MAPPARREQVLMSKAVNPMAGSFTVIIVQIMAVILLLHTCSHFLTYLTLVMGVSLVVTWC